MNECVTHFSKVQLKHYRFPPLHSSRKFVCLLFSFPSVIAPYIELWLHGKDVSIGLLFLTIAGQPTRGIVLIGYEENECNLL